MCSVCSHGGVSHFSRKIIVVVINSLPDQLIYRRRLSLETSQPLMSALDVCPTQFGRVEVRLIRTGSSKPTFSTVFLCLEVVAFYATLKGSIA